MSMSGEDLAAPLGALPPVKIHCAQLVEGALRSALGGDAASRAQRHRGHGQRADLAWIHLRRAAPQRKLKIVLDP